METPVAPGTLPDVNSWTGISELTVEEILGSSENPCEIAGHFFGECQSNGELPATWMASHHGAQPKCTFLICSACVMHLQKWVAECIVTTGAYGFACNICKRHGMHYTELITREL